MSERDAISTLLNNYRGTPHPSTGLTPAAMMFRNPSDAAFPRKTVSDDEVNDARTRDRHAKEGRKQRIDSSKYKQVTEVQPGQELLMRNTNRKSILN